MDVTLSTADGDRQQGRVSVTEQDGRWSIDASFLTVTLPVEVAFGFVEPNGVVRPLPQPGTHPVRLLLFPGVYRVYSTLAGLLAQDGLQWLAAPGTEVRVAWLEPELSEAGQAAVNLALADCQLDLSRTMLAVADTGEIAVSGETVNNTCGPPR